MPRTAIFHAHDFQPVARKTPSRTDGRELVVFESIVALLALLLIISGFTLYVSHAFATPDEIMPSGAVKVSAQTPVDRPFSLVEV